MFADPQIKARKMRRELKATNGGKGTVPVVANPVNIAGEDTTASKAPPMLGEDTEAVLKDVLGLDAKAIKGLRKAGTI